jgi:hypothetical protein
MLPGAGCPGSSMVCNEQCRKISNCYEIELVLGVVR